MRRREMGSQQLCYLRTAAGIMAATKEAVQEGTRRRTGMYPEITGRSRQH